MATVLIFPRNSEERPWLEGITSPHWDIQVADPHVDERQARQFLAFWKPDGCVVNNDRLPAAIFRGVPTVFTHRDPKSLPPGSAPISFDETATAEMAARELLKLNLASYGFVPVPKMEYWCIERRDGFKRALEINFKEMKSFKPSAKCRTTVTFQTALVKWISALPKPAGLFAANDKVAALVLGACSRAGLNVPDDVAIIGADNDKSICEGISTSISSIEFDKTAHNTAIVAALQRKMKSPHQPTEIFRVPPLKVIRRASTFRLVKRDHEVSAALELIRRQACSGLTARDVAKGFPCCRRMAERRFRAATGHSILEEINAVRRATAQKLLAANTLKAEAIAARCGYAAWSSVYRLLQKP